MTFPDYYATLNIPSSATQHEVREAYKKESIRHHPDRNNGSAESTRRFQEIADAYYVLSDASRRETYDAAYRNVRRGTSRTNTGGFAEMWNETHAEADAQFGDVFYDMLKPEVQNPWYFWTPLGALAGMVLGFILANIPGAIFGGYAGNKMGAVRDNKGKSVMEVFQTFSHERKYAILSAIAKKVLF